MVLRNAGILPQHYTASQSRGPREDGGSIVLRNAPTTSQPRRPREDGGSMVLRNAGILPQHYMASHNQQTSTSTFTAVKITNVTRVSKRSLRLWPRDSPFSTFTSR
jgi:hypothetical protein